MAQIKPIQIDGSVQVPLPGQQTSLFAIDLAAGTPVLTLEGIMPVDQIVPGNRIVTRAGSVPVSDVTSTLVETPEMVRVSPSALCDPRPDDDMLLPADQPVLVRDWRARAMFGASQAMVPVRRLIDGQYIRPEPVAPIRMWRLCMPRAVVIYAGSLEVATAEFLVTQDA